MPADEPRRFEPWPFLIAALLAAMIGVSVGFLRVALDHPDVDVSASAPPPGHEPTR
jgi:hypothetical protein